MDSTDLLLEINCCMPGTPDHFLEAPKTLSCGHYVCSKCSLAQTKIKCKRCDQVNVYDVADAPIAKLVEMTIKQILKETTDVLCSEMEAVRDKIEGTRIAWSFHVDLILSVDF